jgi:predicted outer membrane protein
MGRRAHTAAATPDRRTVLIISAAAALILALLVAWVVQKNLGYRTRPVAVSESAQTGPAHSGHHAQAPNSGSGTAAPAVTAPPGGDASTAAGPISELDKQLLIKVRQANLWELPAGRLAQTHAKSEAVRRAGLHMIDGHSRLDQMVRELSQELQIPIPDQPNPDQQKWLKQLENSRGDAFDRFFANQLRNAHGKVFIVVGQVRATTQNSAIRDLAIAANQAVADHMEVLEDTGLVEPGTFADVASTIKK